MDDSPDSGDGPRAKPDRPPRSPTEGSTLQGYGELSPSSDASGSAGDSVETETFEAEETSASGDTVADQSGVTPAFRRGDLIDRYVVMDRLGIGGMGVVLLAHDPDLDRVVAIKLVKSGKGGDERKRARARARLLREARAMARLSHPNIVGIHDVGTVGDRVYVVMEYVEGPTLREWRTAKRRKVEEILEVFRGAGRGLLAAHGEGFVHRDFKPTNLLIAPDGRPQVTDFGLVASTDQSVTEAVYGGASSSLPESRFHTRGGAMMGTPGYMAPEQYLGQLAGASTDQFAFAVTLYETLYGKRPFAGQDVAAVASNVLRGAVIQPPIGVRPDWLWKVIRRALQVSPADRYPSMAELVEALDDDPALQVQKRLSSRSLAMLGKLATTGASSEEAEALLRHGIRDAKNAGEHQEEASLWVHLVHVTAWRQARGEEGLRLVAEAEASLGEAAEDQEIRATLLGARGHALHALGRLPEAQQALEEALGALAALELDGSFHASGLLDNLAALYRDQGHYDKAKGACERALAISEPLLGTRHPQVASLYAEMGANALYTGDLDVAETCFLTAGEILETLFGGGHFGLAEVWNNLGAVYLQAELYDDAKEQFERALDIATLADLSRPKASALTNLANIYRVEGRFDEALDCARRAMSVRAELFGPNHADVARSLEMVGMIRQASGDHEGALEDFRRLLDMRLALLPPAHPDVATARNNLGAALFGLRRLEEAEGFFVEALETQTAALGEDHPALRVTTYNLAELYSESGRFADAARFFLRVHDMTERTCEEGDPAVAESHANVGRALLGWDHPEDAARHYASAVGILEGNEAATATNVLMALAGLGESLLGAGRPAEAMESLERARRHDDEGVPPDALAWVRFGLARALSALGREPARALESAAEALAILAGDPANRQMHDDVAKWISSHHSDETGE